MSKSLGHIDATCHDFDGVFYDHNMIPEYNSHFAAVFAKTATRMFPSKIPYSHAYRIHNEGYRAYGDSVTALMHWAEKKGIDKEKMRDEFFPLFHENLFKHFLVVAPHVFKKSNELIEALSANIPRIRNGIATHGCANQWARPLLPVMGLTQYIKEDAIFGLADCNYLKKSTHPDLVQKCLSALGAQAETSAYTEDTALNLKTAKEYMPKLTTAFFHHGNPLATLPTHIDFQFKNQTEFQRALTEAQCSRDRLIFS